MTNRAGSPTERTPVTPQQEPFLRQYRRLWISRIDLEEARTAIDEILNRNLPYPRSKGPSALLQALTTALVVAYARPFINSRGRSVDAEHTLPGSLLRVLSSSQRQFHEHILTVRNREVAHSDADILKISLEIFPDGDGGISRATRQPFRRPELRALRRMVEKLEEEVERRCEELRSKLPHHVWL